MEKNRAKISWLIILQAVVMFYTISGVFAKYASKFDFFSQGFIFCYAGEIAILGVYAILWQQIIKKFDLSIAYANRACALIWSMIWSILFFGEIVSLQNFIGVIVVILGTIMVNRNE